MIDSSISPLSTVSIDGDSGTGFESTNAQHDPGDIDITSGFDEDTLSFLELAGLGNNNHLNNAQVVNDPQIYDGYDQDTLDFYALASGSPAANNRVSDNSANTLDPDSRLAQDKYSFTELLELYNQALAKQYEFNAQEAQKDREWQEYMSNTAYQRAFEDMKKAGLNPLVALGQLGAASTPGGSTASGSYASISPLASSLEAYVRDRLQLSGTLFTNAVRIITALLGH